MSGTRVNKGNLAMESTQLLSPSTTAQTSAYQSAKAIVPVVLNWLSPKTSRRIADIGCGSGAWLRVFKEHGIETVHGFDNASIPKEQLLIPQEVFFEINLTHPLPTAHQYDMVLSLEVAQFIPEEFALQFVEGLTKMAPVVLFSAAIPGQGGPTHVNEQWPDYWASLFARFKFVPLDVLRIPMWQSKADAHYVQNMMIFVQRSALPEYPKLAYQFAQTQNSQPPARLVHPHYWDASRNATKPANRLSALNPLKLLKKTLDKNI